MAGYVRRRSRRTDHDDERADEKADEKRHIIGFGDTIHRTYLKVVLFFLTVEADDGQGRFSTVSCVSEIVSCALVRAAYSCSGPL